MRESTSGGGEDKACPEFISVGEGENVVAPFMVHYKKETNENIRVNSCLHS